MTALTASIGVRATVSGSFHRGMGEIQDAVYALVDAGVTVLSPADPRVVDAFGEFLFVASDRLRKIRVVQDRHLAAIAASHFVWLVAPDGYVGVSAAMEIGAAVARGVPVYGTVPPTDLTLRQYVSVVGSVSDAVRACLTVTSPPEPPAMLVEPHDGIVRAHRDLEIIGRELTQDDPIHGADAPALAGAARDLRRLLRGFPA